MTGIHSELPTAELVALLEEHCDFQREALLADNVPKANRHADKILAALNALMDKGEEGRRAFERLLAHPLPHVRLYTAGKTILWAPDAAIPVLGQLLADKFDQKTARLAAVDIHMSASRCLREHFQIESFDDNDLIDPLRAYGVELPYQDYEKWR